MLRSEFPAGNVAGAPGVALPIIEAARSMAVRPPADVRLALAGVTARYGAVTALKGVSIEVTAGEILCLLGPSGSGKSTLLRLVAGLERPAAGRIVLDGVEVAGAGVFVEPEQRRVGMVFQDYALFPHLTIARNVAFGLRARPRAEIDRVVGALLDRLDLRRYAASYPHMLSGGERQRAALARALAPAPRVLLMDEPFSSLDDRLRDRVRDETMRLLRETGTTTVVVTHDPDEAMWIADRIALLRAGTVVQCGPPAELYARPASAFAARFFSDINTLSGVCAGGRVETPVGCFAAPHLNGHAHAAVCVRPQHVRLSDVPTPVSGAVVRATYLGDSEQLDVAVSGLDTPLRVRAFGRTGRARGDTVYLEIHPHDVLVLPPEQDSPARLLTE